jgi:hypothetical protein
MQWAGVSTAQIQKNRARNPLQRDPSHASRVSKSARRYVATGCAMPSDALYCTSVARKNRPRTDRQVRRFRRARCTQEQTRRKAGTQSLRSSGHQTAGLPVSPTKAKRVDCHTIFVARVRRSSRASSPAILSLSLGRHTCITRTSASPDGWRCRSSSC